MSQRDISLTHTTTYITIDTNTMIRLIASASLIIASLILFIAGHHPVFGISTAITGLILAAWKFVEMEENYQLS